MSKVKNIFFLLYLLSALFFIESCITPQVVTEQKVFAPPRDLHGLKIVVMPIIAGELSDSEIMDFSEEIADGFTNYYNLKGIIPPEMVTEKIHDKGLLNEWRNNWDSYLSKRSYNSNIVKTISEKFNATAIVQFGVTKVDRIRPRHRKVIGGITVELDYILFSAADGKPLIEGKSVSTQMNAWSGQMIPPPAEAIDGAIDDILDKLPFSGFN